MQFEYDVFISYAHIDNRPFTREQEGWVTVFDFALQRILNQQLGKEAKIWRDETLQGNDDFSNEISDKLPTAATLVSVLSPRYLNSDWCTKEIKVFCELAEASGGLFVKNRGRVFKVLKTPVARIETDKALPKEVGAATGYEFFVPDGRAVTELDPAYGKRYEQEFLLRVRRLAGDIADLLKQLGHAVPADAAPDARHAKPIFVAECASGRKADRERLLTDLQSHGYDVVPRHEMPQDEEGYVAEVRRLLAGSQLSIHLIGATYGPIPDGDSRKSTVVLQNEVAAEFSDTKGLPRILSLPQGTVSTNPVQQAFIDALVKDSTMQRGADLVSDDLQTLIATVHARLGRDDAVAAPAKADASRRTVHLLHDQRDAKDIVPLIRCVKASGLDVTRPVFDGADAGQVREANQAMCMACDAVIIYYGFGDPTWLYYQQTELRKLRGLRVGKPLQASLIVVSAPNTADKELMLATSSDDAVDASGGFSETTLMPFLGKLTAIDGSHHDRA